MIKTSLVTFALVTFVASGAFAAGDKTYTLSKDHTITSVSPGSTHYVPPQILSKDNAIFSNIGLKYPKGLYFCCYGNTVSGPSAGVGGAYAIALQFTPAADVKTKEVDAGIGLAAGNNSVTIAIAADNGGIPGSTIATANATGLGVFGDCCTLATVNLKANLTGGTPYWLVVSATGNTWAAWAFNSTDETDTLTAAYSADGGTTWSASIARPAHSFQILGK